jgi:hypothetical protein
LLVAAAVATTLALPGAALGQSTGTVAGLRAQVTRFLKAELQRNSATVCDILGGSLAATKHGKSCDERWHAKLKHFLASSSDRHELRADMAAVPAAPVSSTGTYASITLPSPPVIGGQSSSFSWYDNCWMLMN